MSTDLITTVRFYRQLGFFQRYADLSDLELAEHLAALLRASEAPLPGELEMATEVSDLELLALDEDRVWWEEAEADMLPGQEFYVQTLEAWSRIARGAFEPADLAERWLGEEGPIVVTFRAVGAEHRLELDYDEGWIDEALVAYVDDLLRAAGLHFGFFVAGDESLALTVLTAAEHEAIDHERPGVLYPPEDEP